AGAARAAVLHRLFEASDGRPDALPAPEFIFAARDSRSSSRPTETVAGLAARLKLPVNATYQADEFAKLARELLRDPKYAGRTVLVCWHHGTAPQLAARLGAAGAPAAWKGGAFDRVWDIAYDDRGTATFRDRPQRLLDGD